MEARQNSSLKNRKHSGDDAGEDRLAFSVWKSQVLMNFPKISVSTFHFSLNAGLMAEFE